MTGSENVALRTIVPILILIAAGFLSRKTGVLRRGDERVLSAYVYYFALPALFFIDIAEVDFGAETLRFILAGIAPTLIVLLLYVAFYLIFKPPRDTLYLVILGTAFGSVAFFGIPFVSFAFPTMQAERLATLSSAFIAMVGVTISITILEAYKAKESSAYEGFKRVLKGFTRNPLILSILFGTAVSLSGLEVPAPIAAPMHMLGSSTSVVANFMLGAFLYGRKYGNIREAFRLSLLKMVFSPALAFLVTVFFSLPDLERSVLVLMYGMPVAVSMIVLSERYSFYEEVIASLILITSLTSVIYLNLWLLLLGYF